MHIPVVTALAYSYVVIFLPVAMIVRKFGDPDPNITNNADIIAGGLFLISLVFGVLGTLTLLWSFV